MKRLESLSGILLSLYVVCGGLYTPTAAAADSPRVRFDTSMGSFVVELDAVRAPLTVENFLQYVRDGFYEGTVFSRVIENFIVQAGGYTAEYQDKPTRPPVVNESGNGLTHLRGTIAMARADAPHSATSQFFINLVDNESLNPLPTRWGYTVFGRVVQGMEIIERIGHLPTGAAGPFEEYAPLKPVIIEKAQVL